MRVLVCGSRNYTNSYLIYWVLSQLPGYLPTSSNMSQLNQYGQVTIIQGECRGADLLGKKAAISLGYSIESYPPEWNKHGKAAGIIRNEEMINTNPDLVIAFLDPNSANAGTQDTIRRARNKGIPLWIY